MFCHNQAGITGSGMFGYRTKQHPSVAHLQLCVGAVTKSTSADVVVAMSKSARASTRRQATSTGVDMWNSQMSSDHSYPLPVTSASGATPQRQWSLADALTNKSERLFGWRTDWPGPATYAAAGVVPFAYREDEGQLYVLLSIQRSDRGRGASLVYTLLGGKVAGVDRKDARRTAAREAHEETHRLLDEQMVLDVLLGIAPAYGSTRAAATAAAVSPRGSAAVAVAADSTTASGSNLTGAALPAPESAFPANSTVVTTTAAADTVANSCIAAAEVSVGNGATSPLLPPPWPSPLHPGQTTETHSSNTEGGAFERNLTESCGVQSDASGSDTGVGSGASIPETSGLSDCGRGGQYPVPSEYFWSGRYMAFAMHLPDSWQLAGGCAAKIKAKQKHPEAGKAEGLAWITLRQLGQLRENGSLQDSTSGCAVRGHHYMLSLLRVKRDTVGVFTWLERLQRHLRAWHGLPEEQDRPDATDGNESNKARGNNGGGVKAREKGKGKGAAAGEAAGTAKEEEGDGQEGAGEVEGGGEDGRKEALAGDVKMRKGRWGMAEVEGSSIRSGENTTSASSEARVGILCKDTSANGVGAEWAAKAEEGVEARKGAADVKVEKAVALNAACDRSPVNSPVTHSGCSARISSQPGASQSSSAVPASSKLRSAVAAEGQHVVDRSGGSSGTVTTNSSSPPSTAEIQATVLKPAEWQRVHYAKWGLDGASERPSGTRPQPSILRLQSLGHGAAVPSEIFQSVASVSAPSLGSPFRDAGATTPGGSSGGPIVAAADVAPPSLGTRNNLPAPGATAAPTAAVVRSQSRDQLAEGNGGTDSPSVVVTSTPPAKDGIEEMQQKLQLQPGGQRPQEEAAPTHETAGLGDVPTADSSGSTVPLQGRTSPMPSTFRIWRLDGSSETGLPHSKPPSTVLRAHGIHVRWQQPQQPSRPMQDPRHLHLQPRPQVLHHLHAQPQRPAVVIDSGLTRIAKDGHLGSGGDSEAPRAGLADGGFDGRFG